MTERTNGGRWTAGDRGYWSHLGERWKARRPDRLWRAHSDTVNARLLRRWLPEEAAGRVLKTDLFDEAFGEGLVEPLAERYATLIGIDLSQIVIEEGVRGRSRITGVRCDVRALPFADAAFTAVASISTLDHFRREEGVVAALAELRRVLAPGGRLILTLDNPANPIIGLRNRLPFRLVHAFGLVPYYVGVTAGHRRARALLESAGFEVLEVTALMHCPRVLAVPACRLVDRFGPDARARLLGFLGAFERLEGWPTRFRTGHFVALRVVRR
ncbi:MAG: methyltransferase domain-containing protein [Gemmatimonadota bacterium]